MKKFMAVVLAFSLLAAVFAGCKTDSDNNGSTGGKTVEGTVEEILQKIYDNVDKDVQLPFLMSTPLSNDMGIENDSIKIEYYIGSNDIPFIEGVASEAAIGGAYSVVLLRLEKSANVDAVKTGIQNNVDPNKWICYIADTVIVDNIGDLVILIMTNNETMPGTADAIHDSFKNL